MDHDHDHHHHHVNMANKANMVMNNAQHLLQQQTTPRSAHSGHGSHAKDMMMMMTFHGGFKEQILFDQWSTQTVAAFIGSWFLIFFVAVLYEGLKTVRDHLAKREARRHYAEKHNPQSALVSQHENPNNDEILPSIRTENARNKRARLLSSHHLIQTVLHILQMGISYLLMLIAMTFNIYLFLAIILGAGLGHFLFGWRRSSIIDYNEHCH
jgi:copper transporter 1